MATRISWYALKGEFLDAVRLNPTHFVQYPLDDVWETRKTKQLRSGKTFVKQFQSHLEAAYIQ